VSLLFNIHQVLTNSFLICRSQLFENMIDSTTMLHKSNYALIVLAQMFLMDIPRTTRIWTLLFVSSSALTTAEQQTLFKALPQRDLALLTSQIMEHLFFISDEPSAETILQRMVELRKSRFIFKYNKINCAYSYVFFLSKKCPLLPFKAPHSFVLDTCQKCLIFFFKMYS